MTTTLETLLIIVMVAVVIILFTGIAGFAVGGEFNRKYGNKLMRLRVATQALAIGIVLLLFLLRSLGKG